jgi:malonyl-CoA decarboxylase
MRWLKDERRIFDPSNDAEMRALAANYLVTSKQDSGLPLDPVARFHLGNGAQIFQVHARADSSEKGIGQSGGVMVNYLYDLKKVSQNHERFASRQDIAKSPEIRSLSTAAEKHIA